MKKIHRFIGNYPLGHGTVRLDDAELARQMRSVLKLQIGEEVMIGDGKGNEGHCKILSYDRDAVLLDCMSIGLVATEPPIQATLYCAILKADHFEQAAAEATEAGIFRIVPLVTKRTVKLNLRVDRVRKIVREAAELAGRGIVPEVSEPCDIDTALKMAARHDVAFFFDPSGTSFAGPAKSVRTAGIFIGPEGGWDETEVEQVRSSGARVVALGSLILRAQTAVTVASYLVAHGGKI